MPNYKDTASKEFVFWMASVWKLNWENQSKQKV